MLNPLREAVDQDKQNAALHLELARWQRPLWRFQLTADPEDAARLGRNTLQHADRAAKLDPQNLAAQKSLFEALLLYRKESASKPRERLEALNNRLELIVAKEPENEVSLRYRVLDVLLDANDVDGVEAEIVRVLRLNRVPGQPHGRLTAEQKTSLIERAKKVVQVPPRELLEEWVQEVGEIAPLPK